MGIFVRETKNGNRTYYVSFMHDGKLVQERSGTDRRAAERLERQRKREVGRGSYVSRSTKRVADVTFEDFAEHFYEARRNEPDPPATLHEDEARVRNHLITRWRGRLLYSLTDDDITAAFRSIRESPCGTGRPPAASTVTNIFSALSQLFDEAERQARKNNIPWTNPCKLVPKRQRPRKVRNPRGYYRRREAKRLISDGRIPVDRRTLHALLFFTGMRISEATGIRVRGIEWGVTPLPRLTLRRQARRDRLKEDRYRVGLTRQVPLHPNLQKAVHLWLDTGFEETFGRRAGPDDYLIPAISDVTRHRPIRTVLKQIKRDAGVLGIQPRTTHETRNTFLTLACEDAPHLEHVIQRITHQPPKHASETYKRSFWLAMCEAIRLYKL